MMEHFRKLTVLFVSYIYIYKVRSVQDFTNMNYILKHECVKSKFGDKIRQQVLLTLMIGIQTT